MKLLDRLAALNINLPEPVAPVANYVPAAYGAGAYHAGPQSVVTSGQLPMRDGELLARGKVSSNPGQDEVSVEVAKECARQCAINALAAAAALVGDANRIVGVIRVRGFVASSEGFTDQAPILNGASDLFGELFAPGLEHALAMEPPRAHARSAVGVAELPLNTPVEVEVEFLLDRA